jgi:Na+/H+-translocating membrane pyrophosphatase
MQAFYANYLIFSAGILALAYAGYCFSVIYRVKMTKDTIKVNILSEDERDSLLGMQ